MSLRRVVNGLLKVCALAWLSVASLAMASEYHGVVTFGGLPLPGTTVTVTATQGDKKVVAVSDEVGTFSFADLADGTWAIDIEMTGFAPLKQNVTVAPNATPGAFEMKLMSLDEIRAAAKPVKEEAAPPVSVAAVAPDASATAASTPAGGKAAAGKTAATKGAATKTQAASGSTPDAGAAPAPPPDPNAQASNDGFLINGSVNNAATSQYSMSQAFGNNRGNGHSLYNGGLSLVLDSSALDARNYSLSGSNTPKDSFTNLIGGFTFGGPLKIPHLMPRGPNFYVSYQRTQTSTISTSSNLVPTPAEIGGNLSGIPTVTSIYVPASLASNPASPCYSALITSGLMPTQISTGTGQFVNNTIPAACISSTAQGLLAYYPQSQTNQTGNLLYNYQVPLANDNHQDAYRLQMNRQLGNKNNLNGNFIFTDTRSSTPSIFVDPTSHQGFVDRSNQLNLSTSVNWSHRFTQRLGLNASYSFSRSRSQTTPFFQGRTNVSGNVNINGNLQDAADYGPPSLGFASITGLSDANSRYNRNETNSYSVSISWNRFRHNVQAGTDFRRQEFNYFSQSNPRGSLGFTGLSTQGPGGAGGSDFADFLLGLPDTSSLAFGNADKYLRQSVYDGYVNDDFRVNPELSINGGIRWDYSAPVTELKGRLVNLDTGTGFTTATPVLGSNPTGVFPTSLVRPDKIGFAPIIGIAWRPISGSSLLVRSGYGVYRDSSIYQATAQAMAQQAPLSTSVSVAATNANVTPNPACPFTIAITHPFVPTGCPGSILQTFAVDPNFRVGYQQSWNLSVQRDLPFALQMVAGYLGIKGTRGVQEFLPNTYPIGATDPYGNAPVGYYYRTSGGNSTRQQGSIQLRRRLRNGFQANLTYTYSKSLDDDYSLGGGATVTSSGNANPQIAQDWTNPSGQRGLSTFDQRHVMNLQMQYTTGMGIGGHTMMSGWRALAYKEWTVLANFAANSGLPETPVYPFGVPGTAFTGSIRGNYLGGPIHGSPRPGIFLNPGAFGPPTAGQWGNARRDSIEGPGSFTLNASMDRTFRLHNRYNLETRLDATNVLNHVAYSSYNTTITTVGTSQFGAANPPGSMRSVQLTMRLRY